MDKELSIILNSERKTQALALSATSAATAAAIDANNTVAVTLLCDVQFAICQGATPVALFPTAGTPGNDVIPANTKIRAIVTAGQKLAAITSTGTGTLYITVDG